MEAPWPLYIAWKQLFPAQKKISFFSMLAIVGVALGVNVMIVVIAFMQGFQQKFRSDIIDAQGHARVVPLSPNSRSADAGPMIKTHPEVIGFSPYIQGQLLLQNREYTSIPHAIGMDPDSSLDVLPINSFLKKGHNVIFSYDAEDVTPTPTVETLEDEVVFISLEVANRLGVRPAAILRKLDHNQTTTKKRKTGTVRVQRLDPFVTSAEWKIEFLEPPRVLIKEELSRFEEVYDLQNGILDLGYGKPVFEFVEGNHSFTQGDSFHFQCFGASTLEVYSPSMIEKVKSDEMAPPREVKVGGIIEVPWQGFHTEVLFGSFRFIKDIKNQPEGADGYYLRFSDKVAGDDRNLANLCKELEGNRGDDWAVIPWFVENAWFFELLKFEEYLMILIMIPIGLVAAFAIAIALMTSVLRKIKEIGLLVAMGGKQFSVGLIFCLQGFIIGSLGALLGCGLALLFIRYRDTLMNFIVERIAGKEGQTGVAQFYDFYSLEVFYPWESTESMSTFISFAAFAILVSTIAGLLPAWRAARLNPADALRSE